VPTARTPIGDNQVLEWSTQLNYQDLDHPLPFAIIDDTTYSWSSELRWTLAAPLLDHGNRVRVGLQYAGTRQNDDQFQNLNGERGVQVQNQINSASNCAIYAENQFDVTPTFTAVAGLRGQYAVRSVNDQLGTDSTDSVDFRSLSPKLGFLWTVAPGAGLRQRLARLRPPLILELTAPGQIGGDLSQLKAQRAWQFEIGTRGAWNRAGDVGYSPSTTSSCGTRSRTSTSSRSPARRSPSHDSRTSAARVTPAPRPASTCCSCATCSAGSVSGRPATPCARASPTPGHTSSS
jgi:hypothetical protein